MPRGVGFLGPLSLEHRFRSPVVELLPPVPSNRAPPVVPNHRGRMKAQLPATLMEPPAEIDIIARDSKLRVEPFDCLEASAAIRHVASRQMLGLPIGQQNVRGVSGSMVDA